MKRVLVVDDSETILISMKAILTSAGYSVQTAMNGKEALETARSVVPDLVITDYNMPNMNGLELIKKIREVPSCKFKPILVLSTVSLQDKRNEARAAGATGWLVKPVDPNALIATVAKVCP